jgi:glycosyltransferase involved in cell wall biosynthesis
MNEKSPLVSICIPTYNRAGMVGKAIDSALAQTYPNIEVLVVDNASQDAIEALVATYSDIRVKFFKNTQNLGLFGNFNRCIELAQGKYIHILHSDDYIDPKFTETCIGFLEAHPDVAMTFGSVQPVVDGIGPKNKPTSPPVVYDVPEGFRKILEVRSFISCPTVTMRRDVYDAVGYYSLEYPYSGDLYQWLRIARRFRIASIPDAILYYRTGTHSESYRLLFRTPAGYIDTIKIFIRIIDELGENRALYQSELNAACRRHMSDCLFAGIARTGSMHPYSGMIFIGFSVSAWSLIKPLSVKDRISKIVSFFLISAVACAIVVPGGACVARKILRPDTEGY